MVNKSNALYKNLLNKNNKKFYFGSIKFLTNINLIKYNKFQMSLRSKKGVLM